MSTVISPHLTPAYQDDLVKIWCASCFDVLPSITEQFTHIVTDPPYGIDKPYSDDNEDDWRPDRELWRLLYTTAPLSASLHMTVSNRHLPWWIKEVQAGGWDYLHCSVYHNESRQGGNWGGQFAYAWEPLLSFTKGRNFSLSKRMMSDVFAHRGTKHTAHPAERDLGIWRSFISHLPEGVILDPFLGSGTTLRACLDLGREAIGIEREPGWCQQAIYRCSQLAFPIS